MLKRPLIILVAAVLGSTSCIPPEPVYPDEQQNDVSPPPPPSPQPPPTATGGYPTAQRTANPDQVLSPYEPYNVIDITGFKSGQLARDPSNQKIFRIP
jgi:hypothetical protein